jgi:hypothetical protein
VPDSFGAAILEEYLGVFRKYFGEIRNEFDIGFGDLDPGPDFWIANAKPEWGRIVVEVNPSKGRVAVSYHRQDHFGADIYTLFTPLTNPNGKLMFQQQLEKAFGFTAKVAEGRLNWWEISG